MEAMMKLAGKPEHKDWCDHLKGGDCNCDPDISEEDTPLHEQKS